MTDHREATFTEDVIEIPLTVLAAVWGSAVGAIAAMDVYANRRGDGTTLSMFVRRTFRTKTPTGRAAFLLSWLALSAWFTNHIINYQGAREYR